MEIIKLFWEWYLPYNNQEIYKDDIAKLAFIAGYKAAQQSAQAECNCPAQHAHMTNIPHDHTCPAQGSE